MLLGLRKWVLEKWGYKPYQTIDRRKRPLRIKMQFISLRAREREFEIMKLRESNMSFRAIGRALGISHVAAHKRFWCARILSAAAHFASYGNQLVTLCFLQLSISLGYT
jgi:hypothetical protein